MNDEGLLGSGCVRGGFDATCRREAAAAASTCLDGACPPPRLVEGACSRTTSLGGGRPLVAEALCRLLLGELLNREHVSSRVILVKLLVGPGGK